MAKTLHLIIRTPDANILDKNVLSIKTTTEGGEIEIYPNHASLTGSILFGQLYVRTESGEMEYLVHRGVLFVSIDTNTVHILCYSCKELKDIEYKTAKEYLSFVEEQIRSRHDLNDYQIRYLENEKIAMVQQIEVLDKTS